MEVKFYDDQIWDDNYPGTVGACHQVTQDILEETISMNPIGFIWPKQKEEARVYCT